MRDHDSANEVNGWKIAYWWLLSFGLFAVVIMGNLTGCAPASKPKVWAPEDSSSILDPSRAISKADAEAALKTALPEGLDAGLKDIVREGYRAYDLGVLLEQELAKSEKPGKAKSEVMDGDGGSGSVSDVPTRDKPYLVSQANVFELYRKVSSRLPQNIREHLKSQERVSAYGLLPAKKEDAELAIRYLRALFSAGTRAVRLIHAYPYRKSVRYSEFTKDVRPAFEVLEHGAEMRTLAEKITELESSGTALSESQSKAKDYITYLCERVRILHDFPLLDEKKDDKRSFAEKSKECREQAIAVKWRQFEIEFDNEKLIKPQLIAATEEGRAPTLLLTFDLVSSLPERAVWLAQTLEKQWRFDRPTRGPNGEEAYGPVILSVSIKPTPKSMAQSEPEDLRSLPADLLHVFWVRGVTPHAVLFGQAMVLDPSLNLEGKNSVDTLTHEFGHVLGFADCYHEFWSEEEQGFVYYALDPENLMCAPGRLTDIHQESLWTAYGKRAK